MAILDPTTLAVLTSLFYAVIAAVAYTLLQEFAADPTLQNPINWGMLASNVLFGLIIGVIAFLSGIPVTAAWVGTQIVGYGVFIFLFDKIITGIINRTIAKPKFGPFYNKKTGKYLKNPAPASDRKAALAGLLATMRQMDPDSEDYLTFDLLQPMQPLVINCVNQAQAANNGAGTYQYAIEAGTWVFLIEDAELTGACHFFTIFGWIGAQMVAWKPISPATLAAIRQTGKFPAYNALV